VVTEKIYPIFEATRQLGIKGHVLGRKIGVIQEIMIWKLLRSSELVRQRVLGEIWVAGKSGARHKVEFVLLSNILSTCVTTGDVLDLKTRNLTIDVGEIDEEHVQVKIPEISEVPCVIYVSELNGVGIPKKYRQALDDLSIAIKVLEVKNGKARLCVLNLSDPLVDIESKRVGIEETKGELLVGPQSIEKAKQTALVAIDLRRKYGRAWKYNHEMGRLISIAVLGNGASWKQKDLAILSEYMDYTAVIRDNSVVRYVKWVISQNKDSTISPDKALLGHFKGTKSTPLDAFQVRPDDFETIHPKSGDGKLLLEIIEEHIRKQEAKGV